MLVTLAEAKAGINVSYSDKDPWISILIGAASQRVLEFIESDGTEFVPGNVPDGIKAAVILYVGTNFDNPDWKSDVPGDLPPAVESILQPIRKLGC